MAIHNRTPNVENLDNSGLSFFSSSFFQLETCDYLPNLYYAPPPVIAGTYRGDKSTIDYVNHRARELCVVIRTSHICHRYVTLRGHVTNRVLLRIFVCRQLTPKTDPAPKGLKKVQLSSRFFF